MAAFFGGCLVLPWNCSQVQAFHWGKILSIHLSDGGKKNPESCFEQAWLVQRIAGNGISCASLLPALWVHEAHQGPLWPLERRSIIFGNRFSQSPIIHSLVSPMRYMFLRKIFFFFFSFFKTYWHHQNENRSIIIVPKWTCGQVVSRLEEPITLVSLLPQTTRWSHDRMWASDQQSAPWLLIAIFSGLTAGKLVHISQMTEVAQELLIADCDLLPAPLNVIQRRSVWLWPNSISSLKKKEFYASAICHGLSPQIC